MVKAFIGVLFFCLLAINTTLAQAVGSACADVVNCSGCDAGLDCIGDALSCTCQEPLPVTISESNIKERKGLVQLRWITSSEINNDFFIIERSENGDDYTALDSIAGQGTTYLPHTYNFYDQLQLPGAYYYRLRQVDYDGASKYHLIGIIKFLHFINESVPHVTIKNRQLIAVVVSQHQQHVSFSLRGITGTLLLKKKEVLTKGTNTFTYTIPRLLNGLYFFTIIDKDQFITRKLYIDYQK